jgi:hypothetical protein
VLASISGAVPGRTPAETVRAVDAARTVHLNAKLVEIASHRLRQTKGRVMAKDPKKRKRGSINGAFAWRLIEMLESPAYRVLTLSAHRAMARLEIEMAHHGGKPEENGRLPCTFEHFVEFGVERHAIAPAIRELVALGFVEITRKGCAGNAGFRQPALYRLTYRHCGSHKETTDEWRRIKTMEEAAAIAKRARAPQLERSQKIKAQCRKPHQSQCGKTHQSRSVPSAGKPTTAPTSISPEGGPLPDTGDDPTPPSVATPLADDAPTPGNALLLECPTGRPAGPKLVWRAPVVRELAGAEAIMRRDEINAADRNAQVTDPVRLATVH